MGRNKKPRNKAHRPGRACIPVMIRFNADDERILQLVPHQEFARMVRGEGEESSWHDVTCRLNIGMTLARQLFSDVETTTMEHALNSICDVRDRFTRVGKYGVSGYEASLIGAGLVLTDEMQLNCTRREMRDVIEYVYKEGA